MLRSLQLIFLLTLAACSSDSSNDEQQRGEPITRRSEEFAYAFPAPQPIPKAPYPWEQPLVGNHPRITKEHFRCNGSASNPSRIVEEGGEKIRRYDCGGSGKHSLPLRDGEEFIYPILLDLVNYIQAKTGHRVVITCGHRCPEHNSYSEPENIYSKHMVGAEVSFYVQGFEQQPELVVALIHEYYRDHPEESYRKFHRYEKSDTNVSIKPWYNREVYVKLFKADEGRNFDNRHPFPYVSIQVRYDKDSKQRVLYNWNTAYKNYLRK